MIAAVVVVACKKEQTYEEAVREICEYPERPEVKAQIEGQPPGQRATTLAKLIKPRVTNPEAKRIFFTTVYASSAETEATLMAAVRRAGITKCWITDPPEPAPKP